VAIHALQDYLLNMKSALFPRRCIYQVCTVHCSSYYTAVITLPLSPKFFRKITYITTLTALAFQVPLTQIDVPPAVYQYVVA
jgi:Rho GTPase-activating protein 1